MRTRMAARPGGERDQCGRTNFGVGRTRTQEHKLATNILTLGRSRLTSVQPLSSSKLRSNVTRFLDLDPATALPTTRSFCTVIESTWIVLVWRQVPIPHFPPCGMFPRPLVAQRVGVLAVIQNVRGAMSYDAGLAHSASGAHCIWE